MSSGMLLTDQAATGRYIEGNGTSNIGEPCPPGYYSNLQGASACDACSLGTYARSNGSSSCTLAASGSYVNVAAGTLLILPYHRFLHNNECVYDRLYMPY
jgi:hypothetical protein